MAPPGAGHAVPPSAAGPRSATELQWLEVQLRFTCGSSQAFSQEVAKDVGVDRVRGLLELAQEGMQTALRGVEAQARNSETCLGGIRTSCAIFDGLRIATRCIALTLGEAQEATALTATGLAALRGLAEQLEAFVAAAKRQLGAANCLRAAYDSLSCSGLEGIKEIMKELELAAAAAEGITQGLEDRAAVELAQRVRHLEAQMRPIMNLFEAQASPQSTDEVLWETRVVDIGDIMKHTLRDARAEAGGWAICVDVATELRKSSEPSFVQVAAAFDQAKTWLRDEGLRAGARSLRVVREALSFGTALMPGRADDPEFALVFLDAPRWLREFVGAAAIFRDAAVHRLDACGAPSETQDVEALRQALIGVAESLESGPGSDVAVPWKTSIAEFQKALTLAPHGGLHLLLTETDREIAQVLGLDWVRSPVAAADPSVLESPHASAPSDADGNSSTKPGANEASQAAGGTPGIGPDGKATAGTAKRSGQQGCSCALV